MHVERMMELDNHHLVNILPITEVDKSHQMLKLRDEILMANRCLRSLELYPHKIYIHERETVTL